MDTTRQQRRNQLREFAKLGKAAFASGLTAKPSREVLIGVALGFKVKLGERKNRRRASETAGLAHALLERSLTTRPPTTAIACRKGCAYCCHSYVGILAPEAFLLADAVRARRDREAQVTAVRARAVPLRNLGPQDRIGRKLPCPLLSDGACSVYPVRPTVCRQATSLVLETCIDEYEDRNRHVAIPVSPLHLAYSSGVFVALLGALKAAGLPTDSYELSSALDAALADPDAERRWLEGDNVLAALPATQRRQPDLERVAGQIANDIQ
jgi:Fe-S-cluster containining protein